MIIQESHKANRIVVLSSPLYNHMQFTKLIDIENSALLVILYNNNNIIDKKFNNFL